jgi:hypothetical protein
MIAPLLSENYFTLKNVKMKKLTVYLMTAVLLLALMPTQLKAGTEPISTTITTPKPIESAEANALLDRLTEIKTMDKSNLSRAEKKELRKEVRATKSRLKELNGGVYLSAGAIIIIVLLLILIL